MSAISLQCFLIPFVHTVRVRSQVFNPIFMQQFEEVHKAAFPEDKTTPPIGFPDMGSGYFSKQLSYGDWYKFNNAQRVHYNFLEALPFVLVLLFIAGLKQPLAALILGCIYFTCRLIYAIGYVKGGPNMRVAGVLPNAFVIFTLFGLSLYTCSEYIQAANAAASGVKHSL
jgi:uncharacterized membrane protein YecN with MAPEG domain